jgi:hypothetical protein
MVDDYHDKIEEINNEIEVTQKKHNYEIKKEGVSLEEFKRR